MPGRAIWLLTLIGVVACANERSGADVLIPPAQFLEVGDVTLHYLDWGGSGDLLLLVPGLTATAHVYDDVASSFVGSHRVVAMTRRDHGLSTRTSTPPDLDILADDIAAVIDHFTDQPAVLVGSSYAGVELPRLAERHPEKVSAIVFVDAVYDWPGWLGDAPPLPGSELDSIYFSEDQLVAAYLEMFPEFTTETATRYVLSQVTPTPAGGLTWLVSSTRFAEYINAYADWTGAEFRSLSVPVLSIQADQEAFIAGNLRARGFPDADVVTGRYWATEFDNRLKAVGTTQLASNAPQARTVVLDSTHHIIPLQRAAELAALINDFLEGLTGP